MGRLVLLILLTNVAFAQKKWDGGGGNQLWADALNWAPDGVPGTDDDIILDNQWVVTDYSVQLPPGLQSTRVRTIRISPAGTVITLTLPSANTAVPGLYVSGTAESIILDPGGLFVNASGAGTGSPLQMAGKMRLNNGGKYIHRTNRGNADLIDKLVSDPGTEKGIFEFDVPGTSGYTVSLTGNNFGTLVFKATAAGGAKSYSGSGTSNLTIRGDLIIDQGAQLTSTLTADINAGGSLVINGKFNLHPVTAGATGRSFVFGGKDVLFQGSGTFSMNAFFRNLVIAKNASLTLESPCLLSLTPNTFICHGSLHCKAGYIGGPGSFFLSDEAAIFIRSPDGIWQNADLGDIRTTFRNFSSKAHYHFEGVAAQVTGDGIPDTVAALAINNPGHLSLSKPLVIDGNLELQTGNLLSGPLNLLTLFNAEILSPINLWGDINAGWDSSFVQGPVNIVVNDSGWKTIPIGTGSQFAPVKLRATADYPRSMTVEYRSGTHPNTELLPSLARLGSRGHYLVSSSGQWQVGLSTIPSDSSYFNEVPTIAMLQNLNEEWKWGDAGTSYNTLPTRGSYGWIRSDTSISGTSLALGYVLNSLLPLELLEFTALNAGLYNQVRWRADQDGKQIRYLVERSADGRYFQTMAEIHSANKNVSTHQWNDNSPLSPFGYYRVAMFNGARTIVSPVVRVSYKRQKAVLFPNPANDLININFSALRSDTELEIVNRYGTVLRKLFVKDNLFQIRVSELSPGFYFVRLRNPSEQITLPFTKY